MDRDAGMRALGLEPGAGKKLIQRAYKARSRALKGQILSAAHTDEIRRGRRQLRELVCTREIAMGHEPPREWQGGRLGLSGSRLVERLSDAHARDLDRRSARVFFDVPLNAKSKQVKNAYRLHSRALVRSYVRASDDAELKRIRRARAKLRTIRNYAI